MTFRVASTILEKQYLKKLARIEKHLEYVFNSPSTINRIIKYFRIGYSTDGKTLYLLFGDEVVREYDISRDAYYRELRFECWAEMGVSFVAPEPVMFLGDYDEC